MNKLLKPLWPGQCGKCSRQTLVRDRYQLETHKAAQVCLTCVPVDGNDMTHESSKLVMAGY